MFFCGRCDLSFELKADLATHLRDHPDATPTMPSCGTCKWQFTDTLALQSHQITNGHIGVARADGEAAAELTSESHYCDRCSKNFDTSRQFRRHRENGKPCCDANFVCAWKNGASKDPSPEQRASYIDLDAPKSPAIAVSDYTPSVSSVTQTYCEYCRTGFESAFKYNRHALACKGMPRMEIPAETASALDTPTFSRAKGRSKKRSKGREGSRVPLAPLEQPLPIQQSFSPDQQSARPAQQPTPRPTVHPGSADLNGRNDSDRYGLRTPASAVQKPSFQPIPNPSSLRRPDSFHPIPVSQQVNYHPVAHPTAPHPSQGIAVNDEIANMQQAKFICDKIMQLMLQVDIFLHEAGEILVGGIGWARVPVSRQPEVVTKLDPMCHLPRKLQGMEYLPAPKILQSEYTADYAIDEFQSSPDRNPAKPALDVVAISCSKIVLADGRHEVVKLAAVDVLTCQILLSHLVCTDPQASVKNWNRAITGLSSFHHIEDARKAGFKVLRGWSAARTALSKFIDKETIILGHNLRADLDALRLIHGRAIDVVKVIEKAAAGPLSKAQITLDSWCRDFAKVSLKADPNFGRDCLTDAFATREIALRAAKFGEQFEKLAKLKSKEYQAIGLA